MGVFSRFSRSLRRLSFTKKSKKASQQEEFTAAPAAKKETASVLEALSARPLHVRSPSVWSVDSESDTQSTLDILSPCNYSDYLAAKQTAETFVQQLEQDEALCSVGGVPSVACPTVLTPPPPPPHRPLVPPPTPAEVLAEQQQLAEPDVSPSTPAAVVDKWQFLPGQSLLEQMKELESLKTPLTQSSAAARLDRAPELPNEDMLWRVSCWIDSLVKASIAKERAGVSKSGRRLRRESHSEIAASFSRHARMWDKFSRVQPTMDVYHDEGMEPTTRDLVYGFLLEMFQRLELNSTILATAAVLLDRILRASASTLALTKSNWASAIFSCVCIAQKYVDDVSFYLGDIAEALPFFKFDDLKKLEANALQLLQWNVSVSDADLDWANDVLFPRSSRRSRNYY